MSGDTDMASERTRPVPEGVEAQVSTTEARQAVTSHVTRYVLGYGLAGAVVVLILAYFLFFPR
jgi:hypothetical protein